MQPHQVVMLEVGFCFPPLLLGSKTFAEHRTNVAVILAYINVPGQIFLQQEKPLTIFVYITSADIFSIFSGTSVHKDYNFTGLRSHMLHFYALYYYTHV